MPEKLYHLRDAFNRDVTSTEPGTLGGNKRLKIYGRLDCASALRWLSRGHYKQNRVFFRDEGTAMQAGYRPCAVCMPAEYRAWKSAAAALAK